MSRRNALRQLLWGLTGYQATTRACAADRQGDWPTGQVLAGRALHRVAQRERRVAVWFRVYQAGLYLPEDAPSSLETLWPDAPRRLWVRLHTEVGAARLQASLHQALQPALAQLGERSAEATQLRAMAQEALSQSPGLRTGDVLTIDWLPGEGLLVRINDRVWARAGVSSAVFRALVRPWLDEPSGTPGAAVWLVSR
jgi:hypothetical protein